MFDPADLEHERIRPLSRREYDRMVALGMFEDERIELLRGALVQVSPQGVPHVRMTQWFMKRLLLALHTDHEVRCQAPFAATDDSEPEPDVYVTAPSESWTDHATTATLVVEVAQSSIHRDRHLKRAIYAEAGVPEYWVVDISSRDLAVIVHTRPVDGEFTCIEVLRAGDTLRPAGLPGLAIAISEIPWLTEDGD